MSENTITILSLGGGVQSTTLALLAEDADFPDFEKPVAAIVADTVDESPKLYAHLEWLRSQVSFPIYIVQEGNGLGRDFLAALSGETKRASQPPFYVKEATLSQEEIEVILAEPEPDRGLATVIETDEFLAMEITQSSDEWIAWKNRQRRALNSDQGGMLWRACTRDYKIVPIRRKTREIMIEHGAKHVRSLIGISTDERQRENASGVKYITNVHPLLEMGWSRFRCEQYLWDKHGIKVPKSACHYCPYRSNAGWKKMKIEDPSEFERACQFDEAIREAQGKTIRGAGIVGQLFVHRSFTPLRTANLEPDPGQMDFGFEQECEGMCGY